MRLLLLAALLPLASPAAALPKELGWSAHADVLSPGNSIQHRRDEATRLCAAQGPLAGGCASSFSSYASFGGRVGASWSLPDDMRVDLSLGALTGGPDRGRIAGATQLPAAAGSVQVKTLSTTYRLVAAFTQKFLLGEDWWLSLGGGLGSAVTNETVTCQAAGALGSSCQGLGGTVNLGWATWEIVPTVLYKGFEAGLRYVGAGRSGKLPWNTFGVTAGYRF